MLLLNFRKLALSIMLTLCSLALNANPMSQISQTLDSYHLAAKQADADAYFDMLAPDAIVFGTDAAERWNVAGLKAYTKGLFEAGGWDLKLVQRNVSVGPNQQVGWFDELLDNDTFGQMRATGVVINHADSWKIAQYHLTIPIPNQLAGSVIEQIRGLEQGHSVSEQKGEN